MPKSISAPSKQWRRWLAMHWFVYIVCFAVLAGSVITFLFPGILPPTSVIKLPGQLDEMIQQKAISAVISAVGATAVVIAWLIGVTNQTVCGERIGVLINWAYPGFFLYYFTIFLTTVLFGAYVGNAGNRRLPVVLAATGILIGVILIGRVCYVFVLPSEERERIAFTYHMYLLKRRNCPRLEKMKNWFIIGRYISSRTSRREDFRLSSHRIMLSVANVTAKKEADGEDIRADDIWELWKTCIDEYKNRESNLVPDDGVPSSSSTKNTIPPILTVSAVFWRNASGESFL